MAVISVVTAGIILAMQSSIVISLGMVGALSIVRFRTAVKDPMDLIYEVKVRQDKELIENIAQLKGISNVSLLAHDGEVI